MCILNKVTDIVEAYFSDNGGDIGFEERFDLDVLIKPTLTEAWLEATTSYSSIAEYSECKWLFEDSRITRRLFDSGTKLWLMPESETSKYKVLLAGDESDDIYELAGMLIHEMTHALVHKKASGAIPFSERHRCTDFFESYSEYWAVYEETRFKIWHEVDLEQTEQDARYKYAAMMGRNIAYVTHELRHGREWGDVNDMSQAIAHFFGANRAISEASMDPLFEGIDMYPYAITSLLPLLTIMTVEHEWRNGKVSINAQPNEGYFEVLKRAIERD